MGYNVYILQSVKDGSYYVGHTNNLEDRLKRHNEGRSRYTCGRGPWKLVYREVFDSRAEAMQRGQKIKRKKSRAYIDCLFRASRA
jgi:putative endonuclease